MEEWLREYANARIRDSCGRVLVIKENAPVGKPARMWGKAVLNFESLVLSWGNWP